jgi:MYXO-CTERM domain-containing protein
MNIKKEEQTMRKTMTTLALTGMLALGAGQGLYAQTGSGTGSTGSGTGASGTGSTQGSTYAGDTSTDNDRGHNWGWIGLLGLAGLMGLRRHEPARDTRDVRSPNPASR